MSKEDFEAEARKRGYKKLSERKTDDEATLGGCCDTRCFGGGNHKRSTIAPPPLEIVYEDADANFEFQPHTQLQFGEPDLRNTEDDTPREATRPVDVKMTPTSTLIQSTPARTPLMTPYQG